MYENLKIKFVQDMVNNGIIEKEDTELYCFGIDALKTYVGAVIMTLGIGILFGFFWESLIFFISFKLLRAEAGGFHASNSKKCTLISIIMLICSFTVIKFFLSDISIRCLIIILLVSVLIISLFSPLPDDNKPITEVERKYHQKRARLLALVEAVVAVILYKDFIKVAITIMMVEVVVAISLMAWFLFRRLRKN